MIIVAILCLVFIGCTIFTLFIYSKMFARVKDYNDDAFYTYLTWREIDQAKYPREEVHFASRGNKLQGFIYGGLNSNGLIVISNGIGSTSDHYLPIIMYFVDRGWRVFAFNNTGVGGSEGKSIRGLSQSVIDLDAALSFVENSGRFDGLPVMLVGHSLGGHAACTVLNYSHKVNAVVAFAGFNSSKEIFKERGIVMFGFLFYLFTLHIWANEKRLFGNRAKLTAVGGINKAGIPVMVVQSQDDDFVPAATTSIYAHRNEINNPNVVIVFFEGENASAHDTVFCSKSAVEYNRLAEASLAAYKKEHKNAAKAAIIQWAKGHNFNRLKANELNPDLMEKINKFFIDAS